MKSVIAMLILMASSGAFANETTQLCGDVEIANSDGMLQVVKYYLNVPSGPFSPAFMPVEIRASGTDFQVINTATSIIQTLQNGEWTCLEGTVSQDQQFNTIMVPSKRI